MTDQKRKECSPRKRVRYENGRFYFSEKDERLVLFILTLLLLTAGLFYLFSET